MFCKTLLIYLISLDVTLKFGKPVVQSRSRRPCFAVVCRMLVPEAAMNKYDGFARSKDKIRLAGQISPV